MSEKISNEEFASVVESAANMMRGMFLDPRMPKDVREILMARADTLDAAVESFLSD